MKKSVPAPGPFSRNSLQGIPYEDTVAAKPPIPGTVASPPPSPAQTVAASFGRPKISPGPASPVSRIRSKLLHDDLRRDSGLAPSSSTGRTSPTTVATDVESAASLRKSPSLSRINGQDDRTSVTSRKSSGKYKTRIWGSQKTRRPEIPAEPTPVLRLPFLGIMTDIPSTNFDDLTAPGQLEFSKRGSMLIGGKKANSIGHARVRSRRQPSISMLSLPSSSGAKRILSADEEMLSQKVRSMYEEVPKRSLDGGGMPLEPYQQVCQKDDTKDSSITPNPKIQVDGKVLGDEMDYGSSNASPRITVNGDSNPIQTKRGETELAGGIEDWEDVNGGDVDRYGFILGHQISSRDSTPSPYHKRSLEPARLQRVSTLLQLASETPRRQRSTMKRSPSVQRSDQATDAFTPSRLSMQRPDSSQSNHSSITSRSSKVRQATNRLPHNRDRRCMDEAGDMLTLPPSLADIDEHEEGERYGNAVKTKEWERDEKWRKMAKVTSNANGGGMTFEFDTKSGKLIERTWKGIPDKWRATAWHSFLSASAKKRQGSLSDEELVAIFHTLLEQGSPDDVQIDIDVPRTINSHIMFRRRYRGGQRLLFRVLHCLSIYFPDTGYVQGMAALAATLLCYFDEEMTFVMLVRLWQLRGLERLYQSGFEGLMQALDEFEKIWLAEGEVSARLVSYPSFKEHDVHQLNLLLERAWYITHCLRYTMVPNPLQLLHPIPCATPHLGCVHVTWRPGRISLIARNPCNVRRRTRRPSRRFRSSHRWYQRHHP